MTAARLSPREAQIMRLACNGKMTKSIAAQLKISERTVETHRSKAMAKLAAKNTSHAAAIFTLTDGMVSAEEHYRRVTELLEANTRYIERSRREKAGLEETLRRVLAREAESIRRHDAKVERLEAIIARLRRNVSQGEPA